MTICFDVNSSKVIILSYATDRFFMQHRTRVIQESLNGKNVLYLRTEMLREPQEGTTVDIKPKRNRLFPMEVVGITSRLEDSSFYFNLIRIEITENGGGFRLSLQQSKAIQQGEWTNVGLN